MDINNKMSQIAIEAAGGENNYINMHRNITPARGYHYFTIFEEDAFFDWCDSQGFECMHEGVYLAVPNMQDRMIEIAKYEYGPEVGFVVFSYN